MMTSAAVSTHFVGENVKALCFVKDIQASDVQEEQYNFLPLVAAGGWGSEHNHVTLHLPVLPTLDEHELRKEFGRPSEARTCDLRQVGEAAHTGDVNALQFVATKGENLLFTASSTGGVYCFKVSDASSGGTISPLTAFPLPQWEKLFGRAATCLDMSEAKTSLVAASESGELAWLKLDEAMNVEKIAHKDSSHLAINGVKMLGRDTLVATIGSAPGSQLRLWDISANQTFPVLTASDPHVNGILTAIETHPTRPELLITGADDGRVCFWDQRRLDAPFRTELYHQRAVRTLKLHSASPRFLFSAGDDALVNRWDFHHGKHAHEPVEYEKHAISNGSSSNGHMHAVDVQSTRPYVQPVATGFLPWNTMALHAESDALIAGSDAQSILILQNASKTQSLHS